MFETLYFIDNIMRFITLGKLMYLSNKRYSINLNVPMLRKHCQNGSTCHTEENLI